MALLDLINKIALNVKRNILFFAMLLAGVALYGKPVLPAILSNGMVLQQNSQVNIWGTANPGEFIRVKPSWDDTEATTTVDFEGNWVVKLETPAASFTPHKITVSSTSYSPDTKDIQEVSSVVLNDVLIGEVWLASGQSNMEMPIRGWHNNPIMKANETIALASQYPAIRIATIPRSPSFEPMNSVEGSWKISSPQNTPGFSATAFHFANTLQQALDVPIGIIVSAWGGSRVEGWLNREILETYADVDLSEEAINNLHESARPMLMYNGMIHPLTNYPVKGFIWYQGESNVGAHPVYAERLHQMVSLWREGWNNPKLPFFYAEIAPFEYGGGDWSAYLREAQFNAQKLIPYSGMVSTNDLVEPHERHNIHPRNKTDVGKRLAFMALNKTYGMEHVASHGPEYQSMEISSNRIIITFDNARDGFNRTDGITGFEIAGEDRVFHPAEAVVRNGKVEVYREGLSNPVAARYCFRNFQIGNLTGGRELPVVPFRTDTWEPE